MSDLPVYRALNADTGVTALIDVEAKVWEGVAPEGTKAPYVVWQIISGQAENHLDEPANIDNVQFQIMVYDTSSKYASALRGAIRSALESRAWILNPTINQYDSNARLYGRGFDANWISDRSTTED